jgi:hypothetical protein
MAILTGLSSILHRAPDHLQGLAPARRLPKPYSIFIPNLSKYCLRAIFFMNDTQDLNSSNVEHRSCTQLFTLCVPSKCLIVSTATSDPAHLFNPGTIAINLNIYLNNVDSPTRRCTPPGTLFLWIRRLSIGEVLSWLSSPYQRNNRINALGDGDIVDDPS